MLFYRNFHHGVIQAFLMIKPGDWVSANKGAWFSRDFVNPLLLIHCSLKNLHGYLTITEVMTGLIFLFIISQRPIVAANLTDMTHFDQIKILSSAEFNARSKWSLTFRHLPITRPYRIILFSSEFGFASSLFIQTAGNLKYGTN